MNRDLIIARYNEDVSWHNRASKYNKFIYNKGLDLENTETIKLQNIGRESHTYLYHLTHNYNSIAEVNVFCQANPFVHCSNFLEHINNFEFQENEDFKWITNNLFVSDQFGRPHHHIQIDIKDFLQRTVQINKIPDKFMFAPGAQFIVSKKLIHSKPRSFYESLLNEFCESRYDEQYKNNDLRDNRQLYQFYHFATILERAWELVFTA